MNDKIFVTGGAGFIGTHVCVALLNAGFDVTVFDNFCNSSKIALERVKQIAGRDLDLIEGDIRDGQALDRALAKSRATSVIHLAGLKAVGESVEKPLTYYDNNFVGTLRLLEAMDRRGVKKLVFSSSATVYGNPQRLPLTEDHPLSATNPYGRSKLMIEDILRDTQKSDPLLNVAILRYFNPIGAHPSGLIGEDPQGVPNNLLPYIAQVAVGTRDHLQIWGDDYQTPDGTGVRDYIHVVDLALGHVKALQRLYTRSGNFTINLGTGIGYSVLDIVEAFEEASGKTIPYKMCDRRAGDIASCFADPAAAEELLGWYAERDLAAMCEDTWRWQQKNPNGYR